MQFPDFGSMDRRSYRPTQPFPVLPRMSQAGSRSFAQDLSFELGENRQQSGHRSTGGRGQIQRLCQGDEADSQMLQFLECRQQVNWRTAWLSNRYDLRPVRPER